MGLDTDYDAWNGSYGSFNRWRDHLAEKAKYPFEGHDFNINEIMGEWDKTPPDALTILMRHSDCDGKIQVTQMQPLIDRLSNILPLISDQDYIYKTEQFIKGLVEALADKKNMEFY